MKKQKEIAKAIKLARAIGMSMFMNRIQDSCNVAYSAVQYMYQ